ncbi:hypothetical protein DOTSEDRAFT_43284 [Dothistroma septosporum NZE10]|uniref:Uncharacterized protein n=1 Tax=Dothistroma septosporum (strain NZE10 / CBS 128990) TaxID=675120 RepID=N1PVF1_DOTSN|nr:hypothetical protein DOTSEDRAFT_43284 [Dothistroma septosporum NZE10]
MALLYNDRTSVMTMHRQALADLPALWTMPLQHRAHGNMPLGKYTDVWCSHQHHAKMFGTQH